MRVPIKHFDGGLFADASALPLSADQLQLLIEAAQADWRDVGEVEHGFTHFTLTLKLLKRTLRDGAQMPLPLALSHEQAMIGLVLDTEDAHEGCRAFLEKRPANFRGR